MSYVHYPTTVESGDKYLEITYGTKPFSDYPALLAANLIKRFSIVPNSKILDLGCGRGELAQAFQHGGNVVTGYDQASPTVKNFSFDFVKGDLSTGLDEFPDNHFDVVFSKSVLEHFYFPEQILAEAFRVVRPGGLVVSLTPSWRHNFKMFFDDFTHRTPFTQSSLLEIHQFVGLENVQSEYFIQLPRTWNLEPLGRFARVFGQLIPDRLKLSKALRFSKEVMLLASGTKPLSNDLN